MLTLWYFRSAQRILRQTLIAAGMITVTIADTFLMNWSEPVGWGRLVYCLPIFVWATVILLCGSVFGSLSRLRLDASVRRPRDMR